MLNIARKIAKRLSFYAWAAPSSVLHTLAKFCDAIVFKLTYKGRLSCHYQKGQASWLHNGYSNEVITEFNQQMRSIIQSLMYPAAFTLALLSHPISLIMSNQMIERIRSGAKWLRHYIKNNPALITVNVIFPISFVGGVGLVWGVQGLVSTYLFLTASVWSGKLLSMLADLYITPTEFNPRLIFCQDTLGLIKGRKCWQDYKSDYMPVGKDFCLELLRDVTMISFLQEWPRFTNWASAYFMVWLATYAGGKKMANTMGDSLLDYEEALYQTPQAQRGLSENAGWLIRYHIFKLTASQPVIDKYESDHLERHLPHTRCVI